ncbi:MAG TPA: Type 1 glutamine amidotransferase-like domain-containing protein [Candidatus Dormibacteraeota bacterium]|nr:Type 1 glutamine amidotransferase-like domain-containing protein [Candidatus Dormibacteraeota bacterium]
MTGLLALVGGDEFKPGNQDQDTLLVAAARGHRGPAFVVPTAAARGGPRQAVDNATRWFAKLGLELEELHVLTRTHANDPAVAEQAASGSFFYLVGGDPGHTASTLRETAVWGAMVAAWRGGAALAGSSAGAMAMGEWTLIRDRFKGDHRRQYRPALGLLAETAVLPHFETFGHRWAPSALERAPSRETILLGVDERSAAVWDGAGWTARGPGSVTVIRAGGQSVSTSGSRIELPAPGREG